MAGLRAHFRPEFLNRVDDTLPFKPLMLADIKKIVDLQIKLLRLNQILHQRVIGQVEVVPAVDGAESTRHEGRGAGSNTVGHANMNP